MELKIFFKDVGQGDSIFLHWTDQEPKFALIDCNLVNNDIAEITGHIEKYGIKTLEFALLSHPHSDHFSGFMKLFEYCEMNGIIINQFIHTAAFDPIMLKGIFSRDLSHTEQNTIIRAAVNRRNHKRMLLNFYAMLDKQHRLQPKGFIRSVFVAGDKSTIRLNSDFYIRFLSPNHYDEQHKYFHSTFDIDAVTEKISAPTSENNANANLLSSLIQITTADQSHQILLCSDATKFTFKRIMKKNYDFESFSNIKLAGFQIAHHGSVVNHYPEFWESINNLNESDSIISVGEGYGHPDQEVVRYFHQNTNGVHSTNYCGGYKSYFDNIYGTGEPDIIDFTLEVYNLFKDTGHAEKPKKPITCTEKVFTLKKHNNTYTYAVV